MLLSVSLVDVFISERYGALSETSKAGISSCSKYLKSPLTSHSFIELQPTYQHTEGNFVNNSSFRSGFMDLLPPDLQMPPPDRIIISSISFKDSGGFFFLRGENQAKGNEIKQEICITRLIRKNKYNIMKLKYKLL